MAKMYEIATAYRRIFEQIEDNGGEVDDSIIGELDQIEHDLSTKIESCALLIREWTGDDQAIGIEIDRLQKMRRSIVARRESLTKYIQKSMEVADTKKVVGNRAVVSIAKNPPKVNLLGDYEEKLPAEYWLEELVRSPNKTALLATHKRGEPVPECVSITQSERVVIK